MLLNFAKIASKVLLTNPRARKLTGELINKAYVSAKPIIKKQNKIVRDTINETSPTEDPIKFFKKLKDNFRKNKF